jgi:6-phosphofructokinase 1
VVISKRSHVDPEGSLWRDTLDATHQPVLMINKPQNDTIFTNEFSIPV